jgi:ATP-dependent DNA ligase
VHEIKHDGYRLMARRDPVGIRLLTRNGHDWAPRYPLIVEAVNSLKVRSCLIDGEAAGLPDRMRFRWRRRSRRLLKLHRNERSPDPIIEVVHGPKPDFGSRNHTVREHTSPSDVN